MRPEHPRPLGVVQHITSPVFTRPTSRSTTAGASPHREAPPQSVASILQLRAAAHPTLTPSAIRFVERLRKRMHRIAKRPRLKRSLGPLKVRRSCRCLSIRESCAAANRAAGSKLNGSRCKIAGRVALRRLPQDHQRNSPHRPSRQSAAQTSLAILSGFAEAAAKCLFAAGHAVASRLPRSRRSLPSRYPSGDAKRCNSSRARVHAT